MTFVHEFKERVKEEAKAAVEKVGYKFKSIKLYSNHVEDLHIFIVLAERKDGNEFATWIYNAETKGLGTGFYWNDLDKAVVDFSKRGYDAYER